MKTKNRKQSKPQPQVTRWFVLDRGPEEDLAIYSMTGNGNTDWSKAGYSGSRPFDPNTDDRGPAVKFIATWGKREDEWYPQTEGIYVVEFIPGIVRPHPLDRFSLGMGSMSGPQFTKRQIACVYQGIAKRFPELVQYLRIVKRPACFSADHPDVPGGSFVEIPVESLPNPCDEKDTAKTYM
jgi:hypothetical protein